MMDVKEYYSIHVHMVKIFKIYKNDFLFQIFIHDLIDEELLCRITDDKFCGKLSFI